MTELGIGIRRQSLYRQGSVELWRQFPMVVLKDSFSPFFAWADHNNPQTQLVEGHLKRIKRLGCNTRIHGTLPLRRQYLPWWLGGTVSFSPLTKQHIKKHDTFNYPQDVETRLRDFRRIICHNAALAQKHNVELDVVSQIFGSDGEYRNYGVALLGQGFDWARATAESSPLFLNETLGTSYSRWQSILGKIDPSKVDGIALQIHHPIVNQKLTRQKELCEQVCSDIREKGLDVTFAEVQFWLPNTEGETPRTEKLWSKWHRTFYDVAKSFSAKSYVCWGLFDDGTSQLPLGGHGQNAFNHNREPKPFIREVLS